MSEGLVLGTAGHIDHGKTTLVRALSGVDCDRLPEEKSRGITIELGFAPLVLPSGRKLSVVDVPGHERLVRTMVSGATGIDLVLFVVAADEGIMPQSREHLAICELLGIEGGVVALTKADTVDADLLELARLEVAEQLQGSGLEGAPVIPVSATTGQGIDELREALDAVARAATPRTLRDGPAVLPVDRAFTMRGFGTVVTGTLRGAPLEEGMNVEVLAEGGREPLAAKVRGLQTHGESVKRARPGSRCAVNLHGIDVASVPRGSVVATPGRVDYRPRLGAELRLLPGAPPLRHGASATLHLGTAERAVRVLLLEGDELAPGERGLVELRLERPLVAVEGDRFILRGFARLPEAGWTIGGGRVLDTAPGRGGRRDERAADLEPARADDRRAALGVRVARAGMRGVSEQALQREWRSLAELDGIRVGGDLWLDRDAFERLVELAVEAVAAHHADSPTDPWVGFAAVRARVPETAGDAALRAALDAAARSDRLESSGSGYRSAGHEAHVTDPELAARLAERLASAGLGPENLERQAADLGVETRVLRPVADHLVREGRVLRIAAGLYFDRAAIEDLRARLIAHLEQHGSIDPAAYKALTGQTRKYTVPLMEYFDAERLTRRDGNVRVLRRTR